MSCIWSLIMKKIISSLLIYILLFTACGRNIMIEEPHVVQDPFTPEK